MSRKQWGHGYFKGVGATQAGPTIGFVGMFAHSYKDGIIQHHFTVMQQLGDGWFLLKYHTFLEERPIKFGIFALEEMKDFSFYSTQEDWFKAWHENQRRGRTL